MPGAPLERGVGWGAARADVKAWGERGADVRVALSTDKSLVMPGRLGGGGGHGAVGAPGCWFGAGLARCSVGVWWGPDGPGGPHFSCRWRGGRGMCPRTVSPADSSPSAAGCGVQVGVPKPVPGGAQVGMGVRDRGDTQEQGWGPRPSRSGLGPGTLLRSGHPTAVGNGGDFMGEPGAGERGVMGTQLPGGPWHPQTLWGTLPGTHGAGCKALAKGNLEGSHPREGSPVLGVLPSTEKTQTPKPRFTREAPEVPAGESEGGMPGVLPCP